MTCKESNFMKVKCQAGCFLNKMAEEGCLSDACTICHGPNKYGSLQPHVIASLLARVVED